ncbi:tyrosine-type recombinase/integrase [Salinispora mooreana]|uniref:tyrosine-type recombinase/integrase n=1 Tax=Salinispora mooreana TaxID=999545 RepID=UPI00036110AC|nr:tyrosine-type recombinase/integrase [Salinispora mooreana]
MDANETHIASYERFHRARRTSALTAKSYVTTLRQLVAFCSGRDLADVSRADIEEFLIDAQEIGNSSATVHKKYRNLRAFYRWCEEEEIVDKSPMARIAEPAVTSKPIPVVPGDHMALLLKACSGKDFAARRDTAMIRLWCEAGSPRVSEMVGITLAALDMRHDLVTLHGKGDKIRSVPFGAKTGQAIDRYLRVRSKHRDAARVEALWLAERGGVLTSSGAYQMLERRCEEAGIPRINPHKLRHLAAHLWADSGGSEGDAMALFGWSSAEMPRRYGRSAQVERAQRAARRVSQADRF